MDFRVMADLKHLKQHVDKLTKIRLLLSAVISPLFVLIWVKLNPEMPFPLKLGAWVLSLLFISLYCAIYVEGFMRNHIAYFLYGGYYVVSAFAVYLAHSYNFSDGYSLVLMLVTFYISLTFEKVHSLLYYIFTILILVVGSTFFNGTYRNIHHNNAIITGLCILVFSVISIFNLYVRNKDKEALRESRNDYQRLLDTSPDGIVVYEQDRIVYANDVIAKLAMVKDKNLLVGKSIFDFFHPEDYEESVSFLEEMLRGNGALHTSERIKLANNISMYIESSHILTTYNGRSAIMTILRDISEKKKMEDELIETEAKYRNIVESALLGVYLARDHKFIYVNKYIEEALGYCPDELYSMNILDLISDDYRQFVMDELEKLLKGCTETTFEFKVFKKNGAPIYILASLKKITYKGQPTIMGMMVDITARKQSDEKIRQIAMYDYVTGLPNRYNLNLYLKNVLEGLQKDNLIALLFIDMDRFKIINDTMGHSFGDSVLRQVSNEIRKSLGKNNFIARYGGDEFVVIIENTDIKRTELIVQNIISGFSNSLNVNEHIINITPSIGISFYPTDCTDAETLVKYADTAMYRAKATGRNSYKFYTTDMNHEVSKRMELETGLRNALQNEEFILNYQPQIDFASGRICGVEALIRWKHPELGIIPPNDFIPLAEETGLIIPIGEWVLRTACKQNMIWQKSGLQPVKMAVNVSYQQLLNNSFISSIQQALTESGLQASLLELEITESILRDIKEFKAVLDELYPMGIKLSIDDFGVGYSSLNILQDIFVNNLKIDKSFINGILNNTKAAAIVKTIIDMGKNLNSNVIAEGVETQEAADFLKDNNCTTGQGYLYSKPLSPEAFENLLRNQ